MKGKLIKELHVGQQACFEKTISESDIQLFAGISGDFNPIHVNRIAAQKSIFKSRIAHGILSASLISTVIGMYLPGPGTIYLEQNLKFVKPVYINDTIRATVEIKKIIDAKNTVLLETVCINQNQQKVLTGNAKVMPPKKTVLNDLSILNIKKYGGKK